jgi:prepilin-type N-terminal cleavage/methylation domain-containing protein
MPLMKMPTNRRRGFTMIEMVVGVAMMAVLLTLLGQMLVSMRQNTRRAEERTLVLRSVENALEEITAAPWAAINEQAVAALRLPEEVRRRWPQAELTGQVTASTDPVEAKQVTLKLSLGPESRIRPVSLTTWVFKAAEK